VRQLEIGAGRLIAPGRAGLAVALVCLSASILCAQGSPPAPSSDLDAFMARVLARRDVNRQTLRQYILDDIELFEILGPGRVPVHRGRREFTWYERGGMHVRSPVRFDGVEVGEDDRRKYEEDWIRRERERLERRAKRRAEASGPPDESDPAGPTAGNGTPVATPRFVSEAYFMDFRFEPGNYYLAAREQLEGRNVLRIEYYPTRMFSDKDRDDERGEQRERGQAGKSRNAEERVREEDITRKMNKTALVTLWVDPAEHQIVKYTFDNVWMDFLPGAWLVRVDDIHASMTMGQPFPDVWLPREMNVRAGVSLATGAFEATYARQFTNYKLGEVKSIIRTPGQARGDGVHGVHGVQNVNVVPSVHGVRVNPAVRAVGPAREIRGVRVRMARAGSPAEWNENAAASSTPPDPAPHGLHEPAEPHAPHAPHALHEPSEPHAPHEPHETHEPQSEFVREIRVHGNAALPDDQVLKLAGLAVGQEVGTGTIEEIERRLKQSGAFESVEVRKRYRSLTDASDVAIVLLVHERPGAVSAAGVLRRTPRPFGRVGDRLMFLPIVNYTDGYGLSYGGRFSTVGALGIGEHLSVPLTWGGTRRAALEGSRTFTRGPLTRVESSIGIWQRENPRFRLDDRRVELKGRAERQLGRFLRTGLQASRSSVHFGELEDRLWTIGADAAFDTRADPVFPRNAFVLGGGWNGLHLRSGRSRIDRYHTDARGYVGVAGQAVAAARLQYSAASAPLPDYERLLLGGASTLRGFRAGAFDGDRTLVTSAELRVPITSVLSGARLGVTGFADMGKAWNADGAASDARWHTGVGAGVFLIARLVKLNLDLAHGLQDGDTRLHLGAGFGF
jgi:hypothetical protein